MRIRSLIAVSCAAVVSAAGLTAAAAQPPARLSWAPCTPAATKDCAELSVPVDWQAPGGPAVTLDLTRHRAASPANRIGVLVLAGTQALTNTSAALLDSFDIITYSARPAKICRVAYPDTPLFPADQAQFDRVVSGMRDWYLACAKVVGPAFLHDNSADEARDVDAIREALGERQISLMHTWENEIVGQMYAEQFPGRVRALVLDGNLDHSVTTAMDYLTTKAWSVEASFDGFADWCGRAPDCALYGTDVRALYGDLRTKAEQGLLGTITPADLSARIGGSADYPDVYFHDLAEYYRTVHDMSLQGSVAPAGFRRGFSYGSFCQDWKLPVADYAELTRIVAAQSAIAPNTRVNLNQWLNVLGCLGWPFGTGNPQHRLAITKPLPVLIVNAFQAPGQPAQWADSVAAQIPGSSHLMYLGPGTLAYRESPCARAAIDDFLVALRRPASATCPGIWPGGR
jgi:pimeloyl-ACP methyl ester carboxylesterase